MRRPETDVLPNRGRGTAASTSYAEIATVVLCVLFVAAAILTQISSILPAVAQ